MAGISRAGIFFLSLSPADGYRKAAHVMRETMATSIPGFAQEERGRDATT